MPASEEDITDIKKNILKEMFGNMMSSHVEGHKDSLQSIKQFGENSMTTEMDSKLSMEVIDNRQNYEMNQDVAHTRDCFQIHTMKTDWGMKGFEDNTNRISEMGEQNPNDFKNLKIQNELLCSEVNTSQNRFINEKDILSCSKNDDELTFVKEAYVYQDISGVDVDCNESFVSSSIVYCQNEALGNQAIVDDKAYLTQPGFSILVQRRSDNVQTKLDMLKHGGGDEMKYLTDIMESEKNISIHENSKDVDAKVVEEKQDVEKAEKCQEMAYAEHQNYFHMLYSEVLSESFPLTLSCPLISSLPISSSFLPMTRSVFVESQMYKSYSFESAALSEENRLSLEWPVRGNFCYQCNIVASRQTNIPSILISDEIFLQSTDLRKQRETILFHADNKTCNLNIFSDSVDWNVFKMSISQKCESKDVFEMKNWNQGRYQDFESKNILEKEDTDNAHDDEINMSCGISIWTSNFEECRDPESLKNKKDLETEQNSNYSLEQVPEREHGLCEDMSESEDSFSQSEIVNKQTGAVFRKVESIETVYSFDTLEGKIENNLGETKYQEKNSDYFQEDNEADFEEFKDLEGVHELRGMEDNNLGDTVVEDNKSSYSCKGEKENKPQKLKKPAFGKSQGNKPQKLKTPAFGKSPGNKPQKLKKPAFGKSPGNKPQKLKKPAFGKSQGKKPWTHCHDNEWGTVSLGRRWFFNNKVRAFDVKPSRRTEKEPAKCGSHKNRQENSFKKFCWKNKCFQPLFSLVKKTNTRRQNDGYRRDIYKCKKEFARKARNKMPKLFQHKINQSQKQGTKIKDRNGENKKWKKQATNTRKFSGRLAQCFQKPVALMKWQHIWQMRLFKDCDLYLSGSPPIRLHLVEAGVYTRSGAGKKTAGNCSSSGTGSTNGNQGNGNNSAQRGNGSGRHSGSGSGSSSGGSGNNNNNNNNNNDDHKGNSTTQKNSTVLKKGKNKKTDSKTGSPDVGTCLPNNPISSPSLPPPRLDPSHVAERHIEEMRRQFYNETSPEMLLPGTALASNQQEESHDSPEGVSDVQNSICEGEEDEEEAPSFQHAAVSIEQLCDIIGISTRSYPSGSDTFPSLNICLTRIIHDLSLAADDNEGPSFDNCSVCLVLSQLLIHMADPGHDSSVGFCEQCSQIFNLIMGHCICCIANGRPKSRITQSDLCYKICKYSQWNVDHLCQSSNKLKGKVQKYCDKVLGNAVDMISDRSPTGAVPEGIGEIGASVFTEAPSTGVSSTTTLSLTGNIVTVETGEPDQRPTHTDHQFVNLSFVNTFGPSPASSSAAAVGCTGTDSNSHMKLGRKPSHPRKTPAIPQPIPEDSQPESNIATFSDGDDERRDDTERIIYRRMMGQTDPYETNKTYGNQPRYVSLQIGNVHDVEQFLSVSTQPLGAPGIGEVVVSHPTQLKIVAGFWDKKREECERTQMCPYQHREEGVILHEYKEHFGILLTRYQKHHQWERVSHLGNGMSGKCHLAIDLKTNFKFCCKKIHLLRYTEEELTLWSEMKNPYVVRLYGAIRHGVKIYIFSEFIDGGSLAACIEEQKYLGRRLSHWSAINYFQQLLKVLAFLQKKNILHEDIKADNILLRRNSTYLAVTDFGTSRRLQDPKELKNKSPVGSPTHWSPEKATMEGHGFPSDLWASVCVLVHMLSGEPPWVKRFMNKAAILNFIIFARPPPMEDVPGNVQLIVRDLIEKGFVKDPQARPSSGELLQHPAFKILDEGKPETYFSTLTSMAHGFPVIQAAGGGDEQQNIRPDVPMFNTADSTSADAAILYEGKVNTGPYQESDNRPDNKNKQPSERIPEVINPNDNIDQQQNEGHGNDANVVDPSEIDNSVVRDGGQAPSAETQNERLQNAPNVASSMATENQVSVVGSSVDSKVRQLVEPLDIDSLLPQFNELFMSGDSLSTQSIKSFFADNYSTEEFNGTRPPPLEMYKPEVKPEVLPNLSIFDWEALPATRQQDVLSESENSISNLSQIDALPGESNPAIRSRLLRNEMSSQYTSNFMLSSESDDCTSADLFEPAPAARSSDSGQHASDVQVETSGSETQRPSMYPLEDTNHTSSPGSSSNTSTLQMRKPTNLTLHCTPLPPELSHSQSDIPLSSAPSANEIEMKHRSNAGSQLSVSAHNPHHAVGTPSSSQVTSTLKKTNGTSVPSTASSGHSQFSYHRSSVKEEQEKRIQELTTDMLNAYSPTSSDSDTSFFIDNPQQDTKYNEVPEYEDKPDIDSLLKTMIEEMDDSKLGGHNLKFFDDDNKYLFTMHMQELPANWRHFITSFRHKITQYGYKHFSVNHMNNKPVKYYHPLGAREFRVIHIQDPGEQCWCHICKPML